MKTAQEMQSEATKDKKDIFLSSNPTEIFLALDTVFKDDDWLAWEPETLLLLLNGDISQEAQDKLLAVLAVAAHTEEVLSHGIAFEKTVNAFCNNVCVMDVNQPPFVEEMCYAVKQILGIAKLVHKDTPKQLYFRDEIPGYVAATAKYRGWFMLPGPLSFAQEALDNLTGFGKNTERRKEYEELYSVAKELFPNMSESDAREVLHDGEIERIKQENETGSLMVKQLIGALLYKPTIMYSTQQQAPINA